MTSRSYRRGRIVGSSARTAEASITIRDPTHLVAEGLLVEFRVGGGDPPRHGDRLLDPRGERRPAEGRLDGVRQRLGRRLGLGRRADEPAQPLGHFGDFGVLDLERYALSSSRIRT